MAKGVCESCDKVVADATSLAVRGEVQKVAYCGDCLPHVDEYIEKVKEAEQEMARAWADKRTELAATYAERINGGKLPEV